MPKFTREVGDVQFSPTVTQPTEDRSTAQAIETFGGITRKLMAGAAVKEFRGEARGVNEVAGDSTLVQEGVPFKAVEDQIGDLDTLEKIAAARKGGLRGDIAKARTEVAFRKALADNPMFQEEIRQTYGSFFQSQLGKTGFFVDPEVEKSPEEIAAEQEHAANLQTMHELNISYEAADRVRARRKQTEIEKELTANNMVVGAAKQNSFAFITKQSTAEQFLGKVQGMIEASPDGKLSIDQQNALNSEIIFVLQNYEQEVTGRITGAGLNIDDPAYITAQRDDLEKVLRTAVTDTSFQQYVKGKADTLANAVQVAGVERYPGLAMIRGVVGDAPLTWLLDSINSGDVANYTAKNPVLQDFFGVMQDGSALDFVIKSSEKAIQPDTKPLTPNEANAAAYMLNNPEMANKIPDNHRESIFRSTANSLSVLSTDKYAAAVKANNYSLDKIKSDMTVHLNHQYGLEVAREGDLITDITIEEISPSPRFKTGKVRILDQSGNRVSNTMFTAVNDALKVARRYPELWKDEFVDEYDYVEDLLIPSKVKGLTKDKKRDEIEKQIKIIENRPVRSRNTKKLKELQEQLKQFEPAEEAPEVSFEENEEQVNSLRIAGLRKKHGSDLEALSDEEILKGLA